MWLIELLGLALSKALFRLKWKCSRSRQEFNPGTFSGAFTPDWLQFCYRVCHPHRTPLGVAHVGRCWCSTRTLLHTKGRPKKSSEASKLSNKLWLQFVFDWDPTFIRAQLLEERHIIELTQRQRQCVVFTIYFPPVCLLGIGFFSHIYFD